MASNDLTLRSWSSWRTTNFPVTGAARASPGPLDAVSTARAAQSGHACGAPKGRDGAVEAIRALMVAKRRARAERTQTINQARALIVIGPDDLRTRFTRHNPAALVTEIAILRPPPATRRPMPPGWRYASSGAHNSPAARWNAWTS